jgi:hypothetical protein
VCPIWILNLILTGSKLTFTMEQGLVRRPNFFAFTRVAHICQLIKGKPTYIDAQSEEKLRWGGGGINQTPKTPKKEGIFFHLSLPLMLYVLCTFENQIIILKGIVSI